MSKGLKWNYYVIIRMHDNTMRAVTEVDNLTKTASWEKGKDGIQFTQTRARDLRWRLCVNGYSAHVLSTLYDTITNPD